MNFSIVSLRLGIVLAALGGNAVRGFDLITDGDTPYVPMWPEGQIELKVMLPASPTLSDGTSLSSSFVEAMTEWNTVIGTVQFSAKVEAPGTYSIFNDVSEVVLDSTIDGFSFGPNTLAVTVSNTDGDLRIESDIIFNSAYTWDSYRGNLGSTEDIRRVAVHELGHALGLDHPDEAEPPQNVAAIMNSIVSDVDRLLADDIAGGQALYGAPGLVPQNDLFDEAIEIPFRQSGYTVTGTNVASTKQSGEPDHGGEIGGRSVWWKWTPTAPGTVAIDTKGSNFDTVLGVYTGADLATLVSVAQNDDVEPGIVRTSIGVIDVVADETYYIAVDGWDGLSGQITLNVGDLRETGFPTQIRPPLSQTHGLGATVRFQAIVSGAEPLTYQWQIRKYSQETWVDLADSAKVSGATTSTLELAEVGHGDSGDQFRLRVSNALGSLSTQSALLTVKSEIPVITSISPDQVLQQSDTLRLEIELYGDERLWDWRWYRDGVQLDTFSSSLFVFENIQPVHAGTYVARVSSRSGDYVVFSNPIEVSVLTGPGVVQITSGESQNYFLRQNGEAFVANYDSTGYPAPRANEVVQLAASDEFALLRKEDGSVEGFGRSYHVYPPGRAGDRVDLPEVILDSASGITTANERLAYHDDNGALWIWGSDFGGAPGTRVAPMVNSVAILSIGVFYVDPVGNLTLVKKGHVPETRETEVLLNQVDRIYGTGHRAFALREDGSLWLYGSSFYGTLDYSFSDTGISDVVEVAIGTDHVLLLKSDGSVWGLGTSTNGELARNSDTYIRNPVLVAEGAFAVAAGDRFSHILKVDGSLWGAGRNFRGLLGAGGNEDRDDLVEIASGPLTLPPRPVGVAASEGHPNEAIRITWNDVLGASFYRIWKSESDAFDDAILIEDRYNSTVWHDGLPAPTEVFNYWIQAVNPVGASEPSLMVTGYRDPVPPIITVDPLPISTLEGTSIRFSSGASADPAPGIIWQAKSKGSDDWSDLVESETFKGVDTTELRIESLPLGLDGTEFRLKATNSGGEVTSTAARVEVAPAIAASRVHAKGAVSLVLFENGQLWGMGSNRDGQLGQGDTMEREYPVLIATEVVDAVSGSIYTAILKQDASLWFVGGNYGDAFKAGLPELVTHPVEIMSDVLKIDIGAGFFVFLTREGELWIMGDSPIEPDGVKRRLEAPRLIASEVVDFSVGNDHAVFTKRDGSLWAGGWQYLGTLGDGVDARSYSLGVKMILPNVERVRAGSRFNLFQRPASSAVMGTGSGFWSRVGFQDGRLDEVLSLGIDASDFDIGDGYYFINEAGELWSGGVRSWIPRELGSDDDTTLRLMHTGVRAMAIGRPHLFVDEQGAVWGFGVNWSNKLLPGDPTTLYQSPIRVMSGARAQPSTPVVVYVSRGESEEFIKLNWLRSVGDYSYQIWRSATADMEAAELIQEDWRAQLYYDHVEAGDTDYHYWVVAEQMDRRTLTSEVAVGSRSATKPLSTDINEIAVRASGESVVVRVSSDTRWNVVHELDWVSASPGQATGDSDVEITVSPNLSLDSRSGRLLIGDAEILIEQAGQVLAAPVIDFVSPSRIGREGEAWTLSASVSGFPTPDLQWYRDGQMIPEATIATLEIFELSGSDSGVYYLEASNSQGTVTSSSLELSVGVESVTFDADHGLLSINARSGQQVEIGASLSGAATVDSLTWSVLLPSGWSYSEDSLPEVSSRPAPGDTNLLEWTWVDNPSLPLVFNFSLQTPAGRSSDHEVVSLVELSDQTGSMFVLADPDPLQVSLVAAFHSADVDGDFRLGLSELLRVIELYNTRFGTSRTGRYRPGEGIDGFATDPSATGEHSPSRYHSADTSRDGRISLSELLRVIELYNTREGTTRTGGYRFADGTSDGFEPDMD